MPDESGTIMTEICRVCLIAPDYLPFDYPYHTGTSMTEQIFNALIEFFEEDEWEFQWMEGMPILSMGFAGRNGKWVCYAQAREPQQQFVFYSVLPLNAPEDKRTLVAEFITRANYGMIVGNFELDFEDGEVRYKTSVDVEGTTLLPALIRQLVYANVFITDRYLPGMMSVMYGSKTPLEAIAEIEKDDEGLRDKLRDVDVDAHDPFDDDELDEEELEIVGEDEDDFDDDEFIDDDFDDDDFDDDDFDDDDFDDDDEFGLSTNGNGKHPL